MLRTGMRIRPLLVDGYQKCVAHSPAPSSSHPQFSPCCPSPSLSLSHTPKCTHAHSPARMRTPSPTRVVGDQAHEPQQPHPHPARALEGKGQGQQTHASHHVHLTTHHTTRQARTHACCTQRQKPHPAMCGCAHRSTQTPCGCTCFTLLLASYDCCAFQDGCFGQPAGWQYKTHADRCIDACR